MIALRALPFVLLPLLFGCQSSGAAKSAPPEQISAEVSLSAQDRAGTVQDLDAALARGERVALVFWQTWCESCREEAPAIAAAAAAQGGRIRFVGVVPGSRETVKEEEVSATAEAWGYSFPQVRDYDLAWSKALGVRGTPTIVVLGQGREVLYREHRPPADWSAFAGLALEAKAHSDPECEGGVCPLPDSTPKGGTQQ